MTKERIKQIDDFALYLYNNDYSRYVHAIKFCDLHVISIYKYLGSILDMSERSDKEPMVIIRELFPDD